MGSTTFGIHRSLADESVFLSPLHEFQAVGVVSESVLGESLHEDAIHFGFVDVEGFGLGEVLQEVVYFLVIDLEEGAVDPELGLFLLVSFDLIEELEDGPRNEAGEVFIRTEILEESILLLGVEVLGNETLPIAAEHGVGLAGAGLAIGEDGHIETFGDPLDGGDEEFEYFFLGSVLVEGVVELGLEDCESVGGYVDGAILDKRGDTSSSTVAISLVPYSWPTRGLTRMKTLTAEFSPLSFSIR